MDVVGTHVGERPASLVLKLDVCGMPGAGRAGGVAATQGLEL